MCIALYIHIYICVCVSAEHTTISHFITSAYFVAYIMEIMFTLFVMGAGKMADNLRTTF